VRRAHPLTGETYHVNEIVDEQLIETQERFPESFQNARRQFEIIRDTQTGRVKERRPISSFIVKLPQAEAAEPGGG
jgi:hypothetical protein